MHEEIYKTPLIIHMTTATQEKAVPKKDVFETLHNISDKPYFEDKKHKVILYKADCFDILPKLAENSIDMIFSDPPYFLSNGGITCHAGKMVSVNKGKWDESKGVEENFQFTLRWLRECQRVLTPNGTIWVSGTSHIIYTVGSAMQALGYKILNDIAWFKVNPPPNLSCRYFTHSTETILWAGKNKNSRHYFNYDLMRKMNNNKQMLSLWSIKAPGPLEKIYGKHPTQKPIALLDRIVLASTKTDDIVLDPFSGSGTTGIAAVREGRQFIGTELEESYIKTSIKRLNDEFESLSYAKKKAKVNIYTHSIDLSRLDIKNAPREEFRVILEKIKYKGYEVESVSDGREIVISKPGGKFTYGTIRKEDFMVWIYNPKDSSLWLISHKNIYQDLEEKGSVDPTETIKIIDALEKVYCGEEPDKVIKEANLRNPCGELPEVLLKVYKWIWGQEDCNYPTGKGRAMSWEGWAKSKTGDWIKTGTGLCDLKNALLTSEKKESHD